MNDSGDWQRSRMSDDGLNDADFLGFGGGMERRDANDDAFFSALVFDLRRAASSGDPGAFVLFGES